MNMLDAEHAELTGAELTGAELTGCINNVAVA
ncbi:hypothetical protein BMS3Abin11_01683 [bacterium BMS3Abin11]|nr:hypothetical protein BMS3Abin11_01683 [bacterium BMS3Abin11]